MGTYSDCPSLQMPEPLQGKWCHADRVDGLRFFMNEHSYRLGIELPTAILLRADQVIE
jgi:hypothetical protein